MKCPQCKSVMYIALVDVPLRARTIYDHIGVQSGEQALLLCSKRKTHGISRKLCYELGLIRRKK